MGLLEPITIPLYLFFLIAILLLSLGVLIGWIFLGKDFQKIGAFKKKEYPQRRISNSNLKRRKKISSNEKSSHICKTCGNELSQENAFCNQCGKDIAVSKYYPHNLL